MVENTKKTILALVLFMAIALPVVAETSVFNVTKANPIGMFPTEPEPLVVTFLSPKNGSSCLRNSITIAFSLQNPTLGGANSITYRIDGQTRGNVNGAVTSKEGERFVGFFDLINYSATLDLSGLSDGWHTLTVEAAGTSPYNPEGGMGSINADVYGSDSVKFLYDVAVPTVKVLLQQNQTFTNPDLPLNFTLSEEADWIGYSLDDQTPVTISGNTTLVGLSEGLHNVTVYANDTVGRMGNSETVTFNIIQESEESPASEPEPFPTALTIIATAASLSALGAGLLVYFKKRKH
jgi:hypothetical protein